MTPEVAWDMVWMWIAGLGDITNTVSVLLFGCLQI